MARISLESVQVATPCHTSWEAMTGDDQERFCHDCKKKVFNLSALSREEAEALIEERTGSMCVRLYRRFDGTVLTADCPVGVRAVRRRAALAAGALAAGLVLMLSWGAGLRARAGQGESGDWRFRDMEPIRTIMNLIDPPPVRGMIVMGEICLPEPEGPEAPPPPAPQEP